MQISGEHKEDRMRKETEIDLAVAEAVGSKYDNACKRLFQNREIIAPVLKEVVPEYKNSTVEEIIRYIDADSIEDIPVDDIPAGVGRLQTEIGSVRDKLIRYDTQIFTTQHGIDRPEMCIVTNQFISDRTDFGL